MKLILTILILQIILFTRGSSFRRESLMLACPTCGTANSYEIYCCCVDENVNTRFVLSDECLAEKPIHTRKGVCCIPHFDYDNMMLL